MKYFVLGAFASAYLIFFAQSSWAVGEQCQHLSSVSLTPKGLGRLMHLTCHKQRQHMNDQIMAKSARIYNKEGELVQGLQKNICIFKTNEELCKNLPNDKSVFDLLKICQGSPFSMDSEGYMAIAKKPIPIEVCVHDTEMRNVDLDCGEKPPECDEDGCKLNIGVRRMRIRGKMHIKNLETGEELIEPTMVDFRMTPNESGEMIKASAEFEFDREAKRIEYSPQLQRGKSDIQIPAGSLWLGQPLLSQNVQAQDNEDLLLYEGLSEAIRDVQNRTGGDHQKMRAIYQKRIDDVEKNLVEEIKKENEHFGEGMTDPQMRQQAKAIMEQYGITASSMVYTEPPNLSDYPKEDQERVKIEWVRGLPRSFQLLNQVQVGRMIARTNQLTESNGKVGSSFLATKVASSYLYTKANESKDFQRLIERSIVMRIMPGIENNLNALLEVMPTAMNAYVGNYDGPEQSFVAKIPPINADRLLRLQQLRDKYDKDGSMAGFFKDNKDGRIAYESALLDQHMKDILVKQSRALDMKHQQLETHCQGRVNTGRCRKLSEDIMKSSKELESLQRDLEFYNLSGKEGHVAVPTLYALEKALKVNEALRLNMFDFNCNDKNCVREIGLRNFGDKEIPDDVDMRTEITVDGLQKFIDESYRQGKLTACTSVTPSRIGCTEGRELKLEEAPQITFKNGEYHIKIPNMDAGFLAGAKFSDLVVKPEMCSNGNICLKSNDGQFQIDGLALASLTSYPKQAQEAARQQLKEFGSSGLPAIENVRSLRLLQNKTNGAIAIDWEIDSVKYEPYVYRSWKSIQDLAAPL